MLKVGKKMSVIVILLLVTLLMSTVCYANEGVYTDEEELLENVLVSQGSFPEDVATPMAAGIVIGGEFVKNSSTTAAANIAVLFTEEEDSVTSKISLQVYSASSDGYIATSADPAIKSAKKVRYINHQAIFKVSDSKKYRVKVVITVVTNNQTTTETVYRYLDN